MTARALGVGTFLAIGMAAGCTQQDFGGEDAGSPFGDTGGLIAVDPTSGGSGSGSSTGTTSGGWASTGGEGTSGGTGFDGTGGATSSGTGGGASTASSSGGSIGGGTSGGSSGGTSTGGSSGGGGGDCSSSAVCGGAFPYCDLNRSPPACVAGPSDTLGESCFSDADCNFGQSGSDVVCDPFWTCATGCSSDDDCPQSQPFCDTNTLLPACVAGPSDTIGDACLQDSDCNFGLSESQVVCTPDGCLAGCHYDSDCSSIECCDLTADPGTCTSC